MPRFKCNNTGSCEYWSSQSVFELPIGETKCPKCGVEAVLADIQGDIKGNGHGPAWPRSPWKKIVPAVSFVVVLGGSAYFFWPIKKGPLDPSSLPHVVRPQDEVTLPAIPPAGGPGAEAAVPKSGAVEDVPPKLPCAEKDCRANCDSAMRSNLPDVTRICNQAAAVALFNSGALAAMNQDYMRAEEDYLAALARDSDLVAAYYNLAALRVRQRKIEDALKMLDEAFARGFRGFHYIEQDRVFDVVRADPKWGPVLAKQLIAAKDVRKVTLGASDSVARRADPADK